MERRDKREALSASAAPFSGAGDARAVAEPDERAGGAAQNRRASTNQACPPRSNRDSPVRLLYTTLICYATVMSVFIPSWDTPMNFIAMLALHSIDPCLLWVAVTSESDDAANAQEAEMQNLSSALGFVSMETKPLVVPLRLRSGPLSSGPRDRLTQDPGAPSGSASRASSRRSGRSEGVGSCEACVFVLFANRALFSPR